MHRLRSFVGVIGKGKAGIQSIQKKGRMVTGKAVLQREQQRRSAGIISPQKGQREGQKKCSSFRNGTKVDIAAIAYACRPMRAAPITPASLPSSAMRTSVRF